MTTIRRWSSRPPDVANLFNPAFCALLLSRLSLGYHSKAAAGLPYALAFLAMPILLHPASVSQLPNTSRTNLHGWLLSNSSVTIGFPERAAALVPVVREALAFGMTYKILVLDVHGNIAPSATSKNMRKWDQDDYNSTYAKNAQLLGKLLAQVTDVATIFALFGIRP